MIIIEIMHQFYQISPLFLLFYLLINLPLKGQEIIKVDKKLDIFTINKKNITWYADSSKKLALQAISQKPMQSLDKLNLGYNPVNHWFKIELEVENTEQEIFLGLAGLFEITNLYLTQDGELLETQKLGIWRDFNRRKIKYRNFVFPINFKQKGKYTLYLKIYAQASVYIDAKLYNQSSFEQQIIWEELLYGLFYGGILIILFYNLFLFFSLKDLTYLYYCIFLVLSFWMQFVIIGHYLYFFGNNSYWIERSDQFVFLFLVSNFWLSIKFLETHKNHRVIHKIFLLLLFSNLFLSLFGFFLPISIILTLTSLSVLLGVLVTLSSSTILFFKGVIQVRFFIIAWIFYLLAAVAFVLKNMGIFPSNFITENSIQIGAIVQVLFLSFALSDKINLLRKERKKAEEESRKLAKENENILKEQNQLLEQKVNKRTQKLQESNQELQVLNEELRQTQEEVQTQRDFVQEQNKTLSITNQKLASSEQILIKLNNKMQKKNKDLEFFNQKINNSIKAAKDIQEALLPTEGKLKRTLGEYFLIYQPKDVVSGDFYWLTMEGNKTYLAIADCTGHGVPGAFMANMGITFLYSIIRQKKLTDPAEILKLLHREVSVSLKQAKTGNNNGMDIALLSIERLENDNTKIAFCGAKRPLYYIENGQKELKELKETRKSIGGIQNKDRKFETQEIVLSKNSLIYLGSDGLEDQNNLKRKKFGVKRIKGILEENAQLSLSQQKEVIENALKNHMKDTLQRDDILWMGIRM